MGKLKTNHYSEKARTKKEKIRKVNKPKEEELEALPKGNGLTD